MKYKLLVVTVTYKPVYNELLAFVDSFLRFNDLGEEAKLVVVDNSPIQFWDVSSFIERYSMVTFIPNPKNPGFGASNNLGFERFESDYVLFMNNDTEFTEPVFNRLIKIHQSDMQIGCIGIHQTGGASSFLKKFDAPKFICNKKFNDKYHFISGAFMFFKSRAFRDCGRVDPKMFMYHEEYDISRRLHNVGFYTCYISELSFWHKTGNRRIINEHLWLIGFHSFCYVCNKYGLNPSNYYSHYDLVFLFIYQLIQMKFQECNKILRFIKGRREILKKYFCTV